MTEARGQPIERNVLNIANVMANLKPPKNLFIHNDGDMAAEWAEWLDEYNNYYVASKIELETEKVQVANLKVVLGREANKLLRNLGLTEAELNSRSAIINKLTGHFAPPRNKTYERCQFHRIKQQSTEPFEDFYQKLRRQIKYCAYNNMADEFLVDQIVLGIYAESTRKKLWMEENLNLDKTIKICRAAEITTKQMREINSEEHSGVVNIVKKQQQKDEKKYKCGRCNKVHQPKNCLAYNKECKKCGVKGYFAVVCRNKNFKQNKNHAMKSINTVEESDDEEEYSYIGAINDGNKPENKWYATLNIGRHELRVKLDTGADCNVLSLNEAQRINANIEKTKTSGLIAYNENFIKVIGECKLTCQIKGQNKVVVFKIVKDNFQSILGRHSCEQLRLVARIGCVKTKKLGCCNKFEYDIEFIENPKFRILPPRRIPLALKEKVKKELDNMVQMKVITPVSEPSPAVSPMVIVQKGEKIRVCMDPTELNKNIKRCHFPLKTIEEIAAKVSGCKYFRKLDCNKGFRQIKVTERTSKFLTMATPWGRYKYLRLPFGISSAPEVFSEVISRALEDINNCEVAMDDIFLFAESKEKLNKITQRVVSRLSEIGFTLNKTKCEYNKSSVKFLGHIFTEQGYKADEEKILAIKKLRQPKNIKELQRLLGMVNYLGKFIPNLSELTSPLRILLHKNVEWHWEESQAKAFEKIKTALSSTPVLMYYDVNKPVMLSVDASSTAIGACLLQDGKPVAYAARAFSQAQQNQPQIVKEALAIRFGCKKFHEYVYGKELQIETDHKPLETIFKNPIQNAPLRLQSILWDIVQYCPKVIYIKGKNIPIADALSRDIETNEIEPELKYKVSAVALTTLDTETYMKFKKSIENDPELKVLKEYIMKGWPRKTHEIPRIIRKYATFKHQLTYDEGLLFNGSKIIVPKDLTHELLPQLHSGHIGINKTLSIARKQLYWYGMTKDITLFVEKCKACQQTQRSNSSEELIIKELPEYPFQVVSVDIFHFEGNDFLLIADHYSNFFDFRKYTTASATETILFLRMWFSVHGIPEVLESDGGPQFTSTRFKQFAKNWQFKHNISSPYYPKSNGFAERNVQNAKNLLKKCSLDRSDVYKALLNWRNTERDNILKSPAERLFSRKTRTTVPTTKQQLLPKIVTGVTQRLKLLREKQKTYADRGTITRKPLQVGDTVVMQTGHRKWTSASIIDNTNHPRSVIVQTDNAGRVNPEEEETIATDEKTIASEANTTHNEPTQHITTTDNEGRTEEKTTTPSMIETTGDPVRRTRSGRVVKPVRRYEP